VCALLTVEAVHGTRMGLRRLLKVLGDARIKQYQSLL
jgi:hypothetical protein